MCLAALSHKYGIDEYNSPDMKAMRCFMHRQIAYTTNHMCEEGPADRKCSTGKLSGFSYFVG
jgi:hypothetical protein